MMRVSRGLCEEFAQVLDRGSEVGKLEYTGSCYLGDPRRWLDGAAMSDRALYVQILGITDSWNVTDVRLDAPGSKADLGAEHRGEACCPRALRPARTTTVVRATSAT